MDNIIGNQNNNDTSWQKLVMRYAIPDLRKSIWQIFNSLVPYALMWYAMYKSLEYPYWVTLILSLVASGFLIRLFIIFHDCGHGSFFKSRKANTIVGMITGILAFTPFHLWHKAHAIHHATSGNLDKRGVGDVLTMTVEEYLKSSKWERFFYRAFRNPFIMFTIGPVLVVMIKNRFSRKKMTREEKINIYLTNAFLLLIATGISLIIGFKAYLLIQLPIILISHSIGIWLFYIQHQFDDVEWVRGNVWDYKTAALTGSSFLDLPPVLQWFTGNIGFHHVHHLSSRIPNYNLASCHYENSIFKNIKPIRFLSTFRALTLNLWDEDGRRLTSVKKLRMIPEKMRMTSG